jgi:hypothetical protein
MFNPDTIKKKLLNATALCGCRKIAMDQCGLVYTDLLELESDPDFSKQLADAEKFYITNLNKIITTLAKKELYNLLVNGQTTITTKTTSFTDENGDTVQKHEIVRKYNGVPVAAIKMGLDLIPDLMKLAEGLASYNALDSDQLEALESTLTGFEENLRKALNGRTELKPLTDDVIKTMQSILLKGG